MRGRYILYLHNQQGLYWRPNPRIHLPRHRREKQFIYSQMRDQRSGQSDNTTATRSTAVYTLFKISHPKEPNQELSNYHIQNQQSRSYIWPLNTQHTRQVNHNESRTTQDHPKDTLAPSCGQMSPKCGSIHGFFFVNGRPFVHTKSRKIYSRSVQACNSRGKPKTIWD